MRAALLVIDMQKHYVFASEEKTKIALKVVPCINSVIELFRSKKLPIFCIQHMDSEEGVVPGIDKFQNIEQLAIVANDIHIIKTYGNAFNKTNLAQKLQELDIDTVILTGYCAEYCVLSTYRGAEDIDLSPIIVRGAIASGNMEHIRFVENINEVISLGALKAALS
jgi:nicotinamidase-related amidase